SPPTRCTCRSGSHGASHEAARGPRYHRAMPERPHILVTRAEDVAGERWDDYADRIREAGGEPVPADLAGFRGIEGLGDFDGLLITAGVDVDPARYGQERSERVREVDPERDAFEEALLAEVRRRSVPVLGICRGAQLINVAYGGSLV